MYKAVIFDFDYTLGDSTMGIVASVNYGLEKLGYNTRSIDAIKKTIGLSLTETFTVLTDEAAVANTGADETEATEFAALFKEKADEVMVQNTTLYDHSLCLLFALRDADIKTGIVTTKFHYRIDSILANCNAANLIDVIVGGEDVTNAKPDPEGLLLAIDKLGVSKDETLYVGDSIVDAKTAAGAGVDFAAVLTGTTTHAEFDAYPYVIVGKDLKCVHDYVTDLTE